MEVLSQHSLRGYARNQKNISLVTYFEYFFLCFVDLRISKIVDDNQLDAQLLDFTIRLLRSSTCFEHYMLIIRSLNCIDAASGIVTLSKLISGAQFERVLSQPVHRIAT